jgi:negative regulator of genetic competence, sporulation and motility
VFLEKNKCIIFGIGIFLYFDSFGKARKRKKKTQKERQKKSKKKTQEKGKKKRKKKTQKKNAKKQRKKKRKKNAKKKNKKLEFFLDFPNFCFY